MVTILLLAFWAMATGYSQQFDLYDDFEGNSKVKWNYYEDPGKPGTVEFQVANPSISGINTSANVAKFTKTATSGQWMNAFVNLPYPLRLKTDNKFKLWVYSTKLHQVKVKLQPGDDYSKAVEKTYTIKKANTWELAEFSFADVANRDDFTKINIHFNDGVAADGVYYFDQLYGPPILPPDTKIKIHDDGTLMKGQENGKIIRVDVLFDTLVATLNPSNWVIQNLPQGVTVGSIERVNDSTAHIILSGNATQEYFSNLKNTTVKIVFNEFKRMKQDTVTANSGVIFKCGCEELVWSDEFNYTGKPDSTYWSYQTGGGGWGNNELENYTDRVENAEVKDGVLTIKAIKESFGGSAYTSARINTSGKADFKYGRMEARLKMPAGQGIWPAFWMLPSEWKYGSWPNSGEIDIMEYVGGNPVGVLGTLHYGPPYEHKGGYLALTQGTFADDFHVFAIEWDSTEIKWFVDNKEYFSLKAAEVSAWKAFKEKFHFLLNLAVGGNLPGAPNVSTPFPASYQVDYVRAYQFPSTMSISGKSSVYQNEKNITYSIYQFNGATYTWTVPEGAVITSGQGTNTITVDFGCYFGKVKVDISYSKGNISYEMPVLFKEPQLSGSPYVDAENMVTSYKITKLEGASYTWSGNNCISITSGQGTDSIVANIACKGTVVVDVTNSCGSKAYSMDVQIGQGQWPYPDSITAQSIPGIINATKYDLGGEGYAYHDSDEGNSGPGIRKDENVDTESGDGGKPNVGWIVSGEWLEYTVIVANTANYDLTIRVASQSGGGLINVQMDSTYIIDPLIVAATGGWTTFKNLVVKNIPLNSGKKVMRLTATQGGFNLSNITFAVSTAVKSANNLAEIKVFPNPTNDYFNISLKNANSNVNIELIDVLGKTILTKKVSNYVAGTNIKMEISNLNKGVYYIKVNNSKDTYFESILIQ